MPVVAAVCIWRGYGRETEANSQTRPRAWPRMTSAYRKFQIAGYTNAGKSTLLNALTGSEVGVRDRLFHTLDPTTRTLRLHGRSS